MRSRIEFLSYKNARKDLDPSTERGKEWELLKQEAKKRETLWFLSQPEEFKGGEIQNAETVGVTGAVVDSFQFCVSGEAPLAREFNATLEEKFKALRIYDYSPPEKLVRGDDWSTAIWQ